MRENQDRELIYQVIFFAENVSVNIIKCFSPQSPTARAANKTARMIEVTHGLASFSSSRNFFTACMAHTFLEQNQLNIVYPIFKCVYFTEKLSVLLLIFQFFFNLFHERFKLFLGITCFLIKNYLKIMIKDGFNSNYLLGRNSG